VSDTKWQAAEINKQQTKKRGRVLAKATFPIAWRRQKLLQVKTISTQRLPGAKRRAVDSLALWPKFSFVPLWLQGAQSLSLPIL
jgi:hypothetical protein